jgi:ubiquinone/menaquinone biosynthesis C-methylase UbiE
MSERTFDNFDQHASQYRKIHSQNVKISGADSFYFAAHKVDMLKDFEINNPKRILDMGCGDGAVEMFLEKEFPSFTINAIDISAESIALAKEKKLASTTFEQYDGKKIPYENESFDIVIIASVLHHIEFKGHHQFLQEVKRVLKIGGRLYIFEHNPANPITRYIVRTCVFDKDAKLLKASYALDLLKQCDFSKMTRKYLLFFPRMKWLKPLHKIERHMHSIPYGAQYMIRAEK